MFHDFNSNDQNDNQTIYPFNAIAKLFTLSVSYWYPYWFPYWGGSTSLTLSDRNDVKVLGNCKSKASLVSSWSKSARGQNAAISCCPYPPSSALGNSPICPHIHLQLELFRRNFVTKKQAHRSPVCGVCLYFEPYCRQLDRS